MSSPTSRPSTGLHERGRFLSAYAGYSAQDLVRGLARYADTFDRLWVGRSLPRQAPRPEDLARRAAWLKSQASE